MRRITPSSFGLWWAQAVPKISSPFRGSLPLCSRGFPLVAWPLGAPSSSPICRPFLFASGRVLLFLYKGLLSIYVLFCFGEDLGHVSLRVLRDREHQVFGLHPQSYNESCDSELFVKYVYLQGLGVEPLNIRLQIFLCSLLDG